jgi:type IV pilus assembly protein PilW
MTIAVRSHRHARGFTLVELMVAVVIGLFITAGLISLVQAMKRTTTSQSGLSQLQDNERMAMSLIGNAVQSAGYFPNPMINNSSTFFTAVTTAQTYTGGQTLAAGQSMSGAHASATAPDSLVLRYTSGGGDNIINCAGGTVAAQTTWTQTITIDANNNLECIFNDGATTTTVQMIAGITNFQVQYGVQTQGSALYNSVDTYLYADQVTAGNYWSQVRSVIVKLTFDNPLKGQPGQSTVGASINFSRAIVVMNKTGVDT